MENVAIHGMGGNDVYKVVPKYKKISKINESSYRDGGFNAVSSKLRLNRTIPILLSIKWFIILWFVNHLMENYMVFQLKVRLNIHIIQNRKITVA